MAYTTINKPADYFNTLLYTATGVQSVTGAGFQPDMSWVKARSTTSSHYIADAVRGSTKTIKPNATDAEGTIDLITSFDSDGVTLGSANWSDSRTAVIWNWLAGGTASSNTDGSITSSVSANTTAGFSIVSYTGTGSATTVGHGLGVAPKMIIIKGRSSSFDWTVGNDNLGWNKYLMLHSTNAEATDTTVFNNTAPTSSVFSLGTNVQQNASSATYIAYCFSEVKGFSKFGSYTGNGSTDGTFIYTGFKPAWVVVKRTDSTGHWVLRDNKMLTYNVKDNYILPSDSGGETTSATNNKMDFLSNGFKQRSPSLGTAENASGGSYIYMAFAESPTVTSTGTPTTAK